MWAQLKMMELYGFGVVVRMDNLVILYHQEDHTIRQDRLYLMEIIGNLFLVVME